MAGIRSIGGRRNSRSTRKSPLRPPPKEKHPPECQGGISPAETRQPEAIGSKENGRQRESAAALGLPFAGPVNPRTKRAMQKLALIRRAS
jgi:hypothetical protein